jgi:6-phosphogluconolactonase (cycloisomerase 2 family)
VDPSGRFAYVANGGSDDITTFRIDPVTGALTEVGTAVAAGDEPESVTVDPSGRFVYAPSGGLDDVTTFRIDPATGALTEVGTEVTAGSAPASIAIMGGSQ